MSVYNGERFLCQALDSILRQTFADFELIVIDDASTDGTASILDRYAEPRLVRIRNDENLGLTRSLNRGLAASRGALIARQDADDISAPDRFRQQVAFLDDHPEIGLLGTRYELIDQNERVLEVVPVPTADSELQDRLLHLNPFCHGSVMLRRECLEKAGGYRELFRVTQDYDLWLRMAECCKLANLDGVLYRFRFDGETISRKKAELQLAYHRLALELTAQRRTSGREGPIPGDVLSACPPEPQRLLGNYRRAAYLFYSADQPAAAGELLHRALTIKAPGGEQAANWEEWAWARGRDLARLREDAALGEAFIRWVFRALPARKNGVMSTTLGRFYADQAFLASASQRKRSVMKDVTQAIRFDLRWLWNRGLWAILIKSLWPGEGKVR
jgi:glycosyltransferase involved in cell wall biosynthesis